MKKSKKGFALTEVLVGLTIFSVFFLLGLTLYASSMSIAKGQKDYTYFESICMDIDKFYDKYNLTWDEEYLNVSNPSGGYVIYNSSYELDENGSDYKLVYYYEDGLVVSVIDLKTNKYIIEELKYGQSKSQI